MDELNTVYQGSGFQGAVRERSEVESATDSVDKGLMELSAILTALEQRLAPVIRVSPEKSAGGSGGATPMPNHSPIVMTLNNFSGRIQNEITKVNMLLNSIQL